MRKLSENRAADRLKMADEIEKVVASCGASCERHDCPERREIQLEITAPGGLGVMLDFSADSIQPDVHVLSWCMGYLSTNRLAASFGGNVNPHHRRKATYIGDGFEDLCDKLRTGLMKAKDGTAYQAEPVIA